MEFKPKETAKADVKSETVVPPERSHVPQRKAAEKLHKSYNTRRRLVAALQFAGRLCLFVAATAAATGIVYLAYTTDAFEVRTVRIEGCRQSNPGALEEIVRQEFPANILKIDLSSLRARIELQPWIRRAEVRRILPSELEIRVEERTPAVILEMGGDLMVADNEAILLDRYDPGYGKLDVPVFKGILGDDGASYRVNQEENTARVQLGLKMLAELEAGSPAFPRDISEVDVSDKSNLKILLVDDTAEINLGDRDFLKRFRRLMSGYDLARQEYGEMTWVDLRFDARIVYHPREPKTAVAESTIP